MRHVVLYAALAPIASSFRPERLFESARTMGFEVVEDVSHHELMRRYFAGRGDDLRARDSVALAGCSGHRHDHWIHLQGET